MKTFLGTIIGGAIGVAALYVVGKIAYRAGVDVGRAEERYEMMQNSSEEKEPRKKNRLFNLDRVFDNRKFKIEILPKK